MTEKSNLWDIDAIAEVTFVRVYFEEEVTKEEAIRRFLAGEFPSYQEAETDADQTIEITGARKY